MTHIYCNSTGSDLAQQISHRYGIPLPHIVSIDMDESMNCLTIKTHKIFRGEGAFIDYCITTDFKWLVN